LSQNELQPVCTDRDIACVRSANYFGGEYPAVLEAGDLETDDNDTPCFLNLKRTCSCPPELRDVSVKDTRSVE